MIEKIYDRYEIGSNEISVFFDGSKFSFLLISLINFITFILFN